MDALQELTLRRKRGGLAIPKMSKLSRREAMVGLAFISPWLIGFVIWTLIPMIATIGFTFTNIRLGSHEATRFVGLANYSTLMRDRQVWSSLWVTIRFGIIALPVGILVPLSLALLMNSALLWGKPVFRTLFYFPYVIPFVASIFAQLKT